MIIQCLVRRGAGENISVVSLDRFVYRFRPQPELTNDDTAMVAEVNSQSHQEYLLSQKNSYREWTVKPARKTRAVKKAAKKTTKCRIASKNKLTTGGVNCETP